MRSEPKDFYQKVKLEAQRLPLTWAEQGPAFDVKTGWSNSYDDVLSGKFGTILEETQILKSALVHGRAILAGRGGDGKTYLLQRLYKLALADGTFPVFIDLKQWSGEDYESWSDWTRGGFGNGGDFIVRRFSGIEIGTIDVDRLPPELPKIVFVDGLNEITSKVGGEILTVLNEIVSNQINVSVLVADRLIRRELPNPNRWWIGTPLPLSELELRRHLGANAQLRNGDIRTSPFFLDAELRHGVEGANRSVTLDRLLRLDRIADISDFRRLAAAAFDAYQRAKSRTFDRSSFATIAGEEIVTKLEAVGTIADGKGGSFFAHHILHDYLAAKHVADLGEDEWTPQLFRYLSFDSSSFDAIELAFEQLGTGRADVFLRRLYDWNLYSAGYALAQSRMPNRVVGREMRTVIFAMLAEKKFDVVIATKQRANDALSLMQLTDVAPFLAARSLAEVCDAVDKVNSDLSWFKEWKDLFKQVVKGARLDRLLSALSSSDSIEGWTAANAVRRCGDSGEAIKTLASWVKREENPTIRWRIAHVLGSVPTSYSLEVLLDLLDGDPDSDVRYGAMRAVVELSAASNTEMRKSVCIAIEARALNIVKESRIAQELRNCLLIDPDGAPSDWLNSVRCCVRSQFLQVEQNSERDLWRGCLNAAEALYPEVLE